MDEYIVRLGGATTTAPPAEASLTSASGIRAAASTPQAPPRRGWKKWKWPIVLGCLALAFAANPGFFTGAVERVVKEVKKPMQSLNGEAELRRATAYFSGRFADTDSYAVDEATLDQAVDDVHWGEVINVEHCFDGEGVVLVADTVRGSISRLLVRGDDVGDVQGSLGCPKGPDDIRPWVR